MKRVRNIVGILLILVVMGCLLGVIQVPALAQSSTPKVIPQEPFSLIGITPIGAIVANPLTYVGRTVTVAGQYRGYEPGYGAPPVTRSDWVIQDSTGWIYVSGSTLGLRYPQDVGKWVRVTGIVRVKNGQPYIQIPKVRQIWRWR